MHSRNVSYLTLSSLSSRSDADGLTVVPGRDICTCGRANKAKREVAQKERKRQSVRHGKGKRTKTDHDVPKPFLHAETALFGLVLRVNDLADRGCFLRGCCSEHGAAEDDGRRV